MSGPDDMKPDNSAPVISVVTSDVDEKRTILDPRLRRKSWFSRNKWLVAGAGFLAVAVVAIGLSVGLTRDKNSGSKAHVKVIAPTAATASSDEVHQLPSLEAYNPAGFDGDIAAYYKHLNDSTVLTPANIKGFIAEARTILYDKFNVTLPENLGSAKTILQYLQISQQWDIINTVVDWARGRNLTNVNFDDLMNLAKQLQGAFNLNSMQEFNKGQSIAHGYVVGKSKAEGEPITFQELVDQFSEQGYDLSDRSNVTGVIEQPERDGTAAPTLRSPGTSPSRSPSPNRSPPKKKKKKSTKQKFNFPSSTIPLVFHVLQYTSISKGKKYSLPLVKDAAQAANQLTNEVNKIFKSYNTNIQFRTHEVRTDTNKYSYLLSNNLQEWQQLAAEGIQTKGISWISGNNARVDQYINVWVAGTFSIVSNPCQTYSGVPCGRGYAWVIPIGTCSTTEEQGWQHTFIMYDEFNMGAYNKDWGGYFPGAIVLAHELGHHLGLEHTHAGLNKFPYGCSSPNDQVGDTPENDDAQQQYWWDEADGVCQDYLGGASVDWSQKLKKFDSCPKAPGTDAIFNIMSYSPDSCRNSRHMALTEGQVLYMQMKMSQCRPKLLACACGADKNCYK